ncbi:MAG: DUF1540 domain-containing protein [Clostridia bacterium]
MNKNNGVCCDVCACQHNEKGCECCLDKIRVTTGDELRNHFCGSFECKPEFDKTKTELKL